jgi:prevent-host-death family protein
MTSVSIHEAKTHLSSLVADVEKRGETIILCRHGRAVAEIVPLPSGSRIKTNPGLKGIKIKGDPTAPTEAEWENV